MKILVGFLNLIFLLGILSVGVSAVPQQGLISHWSFNNDEQNTESFVAHDETGINDGTGQENAYVDSTDCIYGPCLKLDGFGDSINCGSDSSLDTPNLQTFTFTAWMYINGFSTSHRQYIAWKGKGTVAWHAYWNQAVYHKYLQMEVLHSGTSAKSRSTDNVYNPINKWTHIATVFDGTNIFLYINGEETDYDIFESASGSRIDKSDFNLYLGNDYFGNKGINGLIDEVIIYDRALSSEEIQQIYSAQS